MGFDSEFAKILKEKMAGAPSQPSFTEEKTKVFYTPQPNFTFVTRTYTFVRPNGLRAYPKPPTRPKVTVTRPRARAVPPPQPAMSLAQTELSPLAQSLLEDFRSLGAQINNEDRVNLADLKSEYRRLVRVFHPDMRDSRANPEKMHSCKKVFEQLESEIKHLIKS